MSNSFMRSSYFQTQVNNANVIKNCYPCGSNCTVITGACSCSIPSDLTLSTLTVNGKTTINGLIDPTGMEFTPVLTNPGGNPATTIWSNAMDMNKLYYGNTAVSGGGGGWVGTAASDLNMNGYNIIAPSSLLFEAPSTINITSADLRILSGSGAICSINPDEIDGEVKITAEDGYGLNMRGGIVNLGTNVPSGTMTLGVNNDETKLTFQPNGGNGIIQMVTQGAGTTNIVSETVNIGDYIPSGNGTLLSVIDNQEIAKLTSATGGNVTLRLQNTGGKYGDIIASETGGFMAVQANSGYNLTMESTGGSVSIATAAPDTTVAASVNGGNAGLTLTDTAGVGSIDLKATTVSITDPTVSASFPFAPNPSGNFAQPSLGLTCAEFIMTTGAIDGVDFGGDQNKNFYAGMGQPVELKQTYNDAKYIRLENQPAEKIIVNADTGSVDVIGQNGVFAGIPSGSNPDTGLLVNSGSVPSAKLVIDTATASAGLQYDGTAPNPVQFHFTGGDFIAGAAGAASGQYLRIFVNGVEYKLALLNA